MNTTDGTQTSLSPDDIRAGLIKRFGLKYAAALAQKTNKSNSWVSRHICGTLATEEGRAAIAEAIGKPVEEIWPETKPATQEAA
jgi:lambda repressor-like predicted transcriptional regulator